MSVPELPVERVPSPPLPPPALAPGATPALGRVESVTATFLMTDIEGSTRLWAEQREAMAVALTAHDTLLREAVERAGGRVFKTTGDGMLAVFERAEAAVDAALVAQRALDAQAWPTTAPLRVRMAIHAGTADVRDGDYFGPALNRVARLLAIGHGGQVLVSSVAAGLVEDDLPAGAALVDRGEHRLRDLDRPERVLQLVAPGLRADFPPLRSAASRSNLPPELTSFVGRQRELEEVRGLLGRSRMVSLVGVGGTGKTRLMLRLAGELVDRYRDGVWLVELAPIADPGLVTQAVARVLGVPDTGRPEVEAVVDFLREKDLLLLLDNCEHLIDAAATLAERLLRDCRAMRIVATSREALGIDGEASVPVPSLGLPGGRALGPEQLAEPVDPAAVAAADSVRLFVDRASTTLPGFALDAVTAGPVVEICRRLDGIPLALELAAARVNVLSADEIAQGLGDRFRLLTGGRRTAVPRQRTLQALIDWSWDLLDDEDRRLLRRLSVFAGGWTLDAAAAVTFGEASEGDAAPAGAVGAAARLETLDGMSRLVDRSLVVAEHAGSTRYRMLETIRQYSADQLAASGETVALRDRHLGVLRRLALDAERGLDGPELPVWLGHLDAEIDNVRAALDWALEAHPVAGLEMCVAMARYWRSRTMGSEGRDRMLAAVDAVRALQVPESPDAARTRSILLARGLAAAAVMAVMGGRGDVTAEVTESVAAARESGDPATIAEALYVSLFGPDPRAVATRYADWHPVADEATRLATELGEPGLLGRVLMTRAMLEAASDPAATEHLLEQASEAARRSGNPQDIGLLAQTRGRVASRAGDLPEARRWFREAQECFCAIGDRRFALSAQSELAHALRRDGRLDEAEAEYRGTIRGWQHSGNRGAVANQLESFAFVAVARGDGLRAARLLGAAEALRGVAEAPMSDFERLEYEREVGRARGATEADAFGAAWAEGRRMTADAAVTFALSG